MLPYSILAPDLERPHLRLLRAILRQAQLPDVTPLDDLAQLPTVHPFILSFGKVALDEWHDFGLIHIGAHHGRMFTHPIAGRTRGIMVLHHPATLMQLSFTGYQAKDDMRADLLAFRKVLEGRLRVEDLRVTRCVKCKEGPRLVVGYEARLDGVGLCEDHWRKRAKFTKKAAPRPKPGTPEAQIPGQLAMI